MGQEQNVSWYSYSVGGGGAGAAGGCRPKKIKPKKVPQRGLGVAQLEKIISEEQQKSESLRAKNAVAVASHSEASSSSSSFLGVQKFRPNISPFHTSLPPSSPNGVFRHAQSAPNIEILQESFSLLNHSRLEGLPRLWGGECHLAMEKHQSLDHHVFAFDQLEKPQRSHPHPSSMVQSGISPSSVLNSHLEPPSNQSSHCNNYAPQWSEEEKMIGMKRPYPFHLESSPPSSVLCNFHPSYASSSSRPEKLCSTTMAEPRNKCTRGDDADDDDESLNGDFLTLAPPSDASRHSKSKHNHGSDYECRASQEYDMRRKQSFNFFPIKLPTYPCTNSVRSGKDEDGGGVDLNLKL